MKARVKATGEIVDVVFLNESVCSDGEKIYIWTDGKRDYLQDKLDFNYSDMPSEQRMRYELTKIAMQSILMRDFYKKHPIPYVQYTELSAESIRIADEIIKQLKET